LVIATDVTARMRTERKLREALEAERASALRLRTLDEMKNTFLNAVSHELRTPLAAVIGSAKTMERMGADLSDEEQRHMLRAITRNAEKLQRMLSDLLDLDRMARGVLRAHRTPEELASLVRRVAEDPEVIHDRSVEMEAHQMVLPVDPPKVERIVENLLANAVKYSPPGTPIMVRLLRVTDGAELVVEDHGPGVPDELREQIFEPFRQGPNAQTHAPGVGIGLSLVARFAEMHGGRAWFEPRVGGGSSFHVLLRDPTAPRSEESSSGWAN
jgi:signal transduction histidine kinase